MIKDTSIVLQEPAQIDIFAGLYFCFTVQAICDCRVFGPSTIYRSDPLVFLPITIILIKLCETP